MDLHAPSYSLLHIGIALAAGFVIGRVVAGAADPRRREENAREQRRLQREVAETARKLPDELRTRAVSLIAAGKYIEAIKHVRESTGLGLREAKGVVDALSSQVAKR